MSTPENSRRPWSGRRTLVGTAVIAALVVVALLTFGAASGRPAAHQSGDASAAHSAMSSTHQLSRAQGHASAVSRASGNAAHSSLSGSSSSSLVFRGSGSSSNSAAARLLAATGCGASGTIADKSGFEDADGNLLVDKAGCADWNSFKPVTWTGTVPYQNATKSISTTSGNFTFFGASDAFNSNTDTSYAGGVKQADECPATGTGSVDNKADIARIYVAVSTDPVTKHVYLDLAWIRAPQNTTSSDVHVGFEFNQSQTPCPAGSSPLVHRTAGDILLVYNFQSGSASIAYSQWTGSAWTAETTLASNVAEAKVFDTASATTLDDIKPSNGLDPATDEFGEAGVDLTAATSGLGNNGRPCEQFGRVFGESRTSGSSTTAQMKDIVGPAAIDVSNCVTPDLTTTQLPASGAMGDTFKDKATLSGANTPDGTGSITFKLYSAADCGGSVLDTETVNNINANGDYTTPNGFVIQNAGTYYWVASFSGDGFNNGKTTGCNDEPVTVGQASPSIVTTQLPASGNIGDTYKDKATLSGGVNYKGTGSITFKLYSAADCGGSVLDTETVNNIAANGDYTTPNGFAIQHAGTYYWVASFSGDANNKAFTSGCNDEPVTVAKNSPALSTTQNPASGAIGDLYKDTAHLSGGAAPTGTITFKLYSAADCGGTLLDTETATVNAGNGDYSTPTGFHIQHAGTYYWVASYGGDSDNNPAGPTGCNDEPVTVAKNSPGLSTTQNPASGAIGDLYKDTAHLTGGAAPTGTITFKLYSAADCGGTLLDTETATVNAGNGDYSTPTGFHIQHAGTYYWVASYGGDPDNNPAGPTGCNDEPVTVAKNSPLLSTTQNPASGAIGDLYKDTAHLSGGAAPTGTITFTLYSNPDCTGVLDTEQVTVNGNNDYQTPTGFHIQDAGTYYWTASYSGDPDNNPAKETSCTAEPVDVAPNQPSIVTTQLPATAVVGSTFNDKATLSGGSSYKGTGSITFTLYSAKDCGGDVLDTETVDNIAANGDYTTPNGFAIQKAGTYYWVASFSGDANNEPFTSGCNDEPVVVTPASPKIVTTQQPATAVVGSTFNDKATLSDAVNLDGTGSITFTLYSAKDCGGEVLDTETVDNIAANGDYTTPTGVTILNTGTYYWVASFSGDSNNDLVVSGCNDEPVVVTPAQPSIVTTQKPLSGGLDETFNDTATLSGAVNPDGTGSITFKLYTAADCGGQVLDTETVTGINANGDYTTPNGFVIKNAGLYYWVASFSGDSNNKAFTSGCNDEPVGVGLNSPTITTTQKPDSGAIGDTYKDTATLSGGADLLGTGSITFTLYSAKDCGGEVLDTETVDNIAANGDYTTSDGFAIQNAGTYYWVASFSGDANNNPIVSGCNDEPVVVAPNQPSIVTTQQPASGSVGDTYNDKATLSGGVNYDGTGSITFKLYDAADCGGTVVDTETVANVTDNGDFTTPTGVELDKAGTYYWVASFSGDSNNKAFTSGCNDEPVVVQPADIQIVKKADKPQVNAGEDIGFTLTVFNTGAGDAHGVKLTDTLPVKDGLNWSIDDQGAGWNSTCAIDTQTGVLSCGPVTVPAGTTEAQSTFTVHITSHTTAATGGTCPEGSGVVTNTGDVSTTNDGSGDSTASTCVAAPDIQIVKTADKPQVNAGEDIGFTLTVYNTGSGDAHGVKLTDTLPVKDGLNWSIDDQGAGWGDSCSIDTQTGVLSCGPVTVPAGTTQEASTFTVHITSPTTIATSGDCPEGSGVVTNTGDVSTTNDGSGDSTASTCVAAPSVTITKTADHQAPVNAGDQIGFTVEIKNNGSGDATGVTLSDPLPAGSGSGVTWSIGSQSPASTFAISGAPGSQKLTLNGQPVTVPAGADWKVHIVASTSQTECSVYDNTATLTIGNGPSPEPVSAEESCQFRVDLSITKAGSPATQTLGDGNITWTIVVKNNGPDMDTGVQISDPMPAGNTFVSATTTKGTCTGGAVLHCTIGDMAAGETVTITLVTTPSTVGAQTNTVMVVGDRHETNTANNTATATVQTVGVVTPPVYCIAVSKVTPKQLFVGRKTTLTIHLTQHNQTTNQIKAIKGVKVRIKGPKINVVTKASNIKGIIKHQLKMKKAGILVITPIATKHCNTKRVGITGVFTPPVTG